LAATLTDPRDGAPGPRTSSLVVAIAVRPRKCIAQRGGLIGEERPSASRASGAPLENLGDHNYARASLSYSKPQQVS
jgi:hypothetical protein